jgi:hypothetical protein
MASGGGVSGPPGVEHHLGHGRFHQDHELLKSKFWSWVQRPDHGTTEIKAPVLSSTFRPWTLEIKAPVMTCAS